MHVVIYRDGLLWHDPHPSRAGLVAVTTATCWRRVEHNHQPTPSTTPPATGATT